MEDARDGADEDVVDAPRLQRAEDRARVEPPPAVLSGHGQSSAVTSGERACDRGVPSASCARLVEWRQALDLRLHELEREVEAARTHDLQQRLEARDDTVALPASDLSAVLTRPFGELLL
jgi:hypothetical protein